MTDWATINRVVSETLAGISTVDPDTDVAWPGLPFTKPDNAVWYRPVVETARSRQATFGTASPVKRDVGTVLIQVFAPGGDVDGTGPGELDTPIAELVEAFQWQTIDGVKFLTATVKQIGRAEDDFGLLVEVPFVFDKCTPLP